jgi:hypothetical protein
MRIGTGSDFWELEPNVDPVLELEPDFFKYIYIFGGNTSLENSGLTTS